MRLQKYLFCLLLAYFVHLTSVHLLSRPIVFKCWITNRRRFSHQRRNNWCIAVSTIYVNSRRWRRRKWGERRRWRGRRRRNNLWRLIKFYYNRPWNRPTGETTLKKTRWVHYVIGGVETCTYYRQYSVRKFCNCIFSKMVSVMKKCVRTIFVDNCMIYNFCLTYFFIKLTVSLKN